MIFTAVAVSTAALAFTPASASGHGPDRVPLTRAELEARAGDAFSRLDVNHDGMLSPADRDAKFAEHFATADSDGDGLLSLAEASAARESRRDQRRERVAEVRPGDGPRGKGGAGRQPFGSLAGIVRSADADGDKQISQAEFNTAALARFDRADADSDGAITRGERRKAMRGAFRPKRMRLRD